MFLSSCSALIISPNLFSGVVNKCKYSVKIKSRFFFSTGNCKATIICLGIEGELTPSNKDKSVVTVAFFNSTTLKSGHCG